MARCDYINGRLGAMRARMLGGAGLRELLARGEPAGQLEFLRATPWREAVPDDGDLHQLELATQSLVLRDARRLGEWIEGPRQRELFGVVAELVDADHVRAILRLLARGVAGHHSDQHGDLLAQADVPAAVALLSAQNHPLAAALREALPAFERYRDVAALEQAIERASIERALELLQGHDADARLVRRLFGLAIDLHNVALGVAVGFGRILPGGTLAAAELPAAAVRWLGDPVPTPFVADRRLSRILVDAAQREARAEPLSLAAPLAYLLARLDEARSIRLILAGTAYALPADELTTLAEAA